MSKPLTKKAKIKIVSAAVFLAILVGLSFLLLSGDNLEIVKDLFKKDITKEEVRDLLSSLGFRGYVTIGILSMLQVVFTFLPAEPVQVMAGVSFGLLNGAGICLIGVIVGNTVIYVVYKLLGQRLTEYFENNLEFDFEAASRSSKVALVIFILYFLPAIPYGLICFFAASLNMKYPKYIFLTVVGSIPSIFIGVGLGHLAIATSWILSLSILFVLVVVLIILVKNKKKVFKKVNQFIKERERKAQIPKKPSLFLLNVASFIASLIYFRKIKYKLINNVGKLERPSLVLCNHGSFIDFVYAGKLLKKNRPNFIAARMYFYNKNLRKLLKLYGCIPKSMFTTDMENAKKCLKVLSNDGIVAFMPEARLSTVGKFEGIQDSTYKFIKRMGVPVYTIRLNGDYLAKPKWGKGARKGSFVTAELNMLFTANEIKGAPMELVKQKVEEALYYDEMEWLSAHPEIHYKSKNLAEGLENILYTCPSCGRKHCLNTKNNTIYCEFCNLSAQITDRYVFKDGVPFNSFVEWYEWQNQLLKNEFIKDENYAVTSRVELRHASKDGKGFTRHAGEGYCVLDKNGLLYKGASDGKEIEKFFALSEIYRLLFGAGEDFEIYEGSEIWYFVPENKRSAVIFYVASEILKEIYDK